MTMTNLGHNKVDDAGLEQNPAVNAQFGQSALQYQPDQAYVESGAEHQRGQGTTLVDFATLRKVSMTNLLLSLKDY